MPSSAYGPTWVRIVIHAGGRLRKRSSTPVTIQHCCSSVNRFCTLAASVDLPALDVPLRTTTHPSTAWSATSHPEHRARDDGAEPGDRAVHGSLDGHALGQQRADASEVEPLVTCEVLPGDATGVPQQRDACQFAPGIALV